MCLQYRRHRFDLWVGKISWRRKSILLQYLAWRRKQQLTQYIYIYIYNITTKPPLPIWIKWVGVSYLVVSLCNFTNCCSSGFSVYGILQARILEWVAIFFSTTEPKPKRKRCIVYLIAVRFENISLFIFML